MTAGVLLHFVVIIATGGIAGAVAWKVSIADAWKMSGFAISLNLIIGWLVFLLLSLYRCRETAGWLYLATTGGRVLAVVMAIALAIEWNRHWKSSAFVLIVMSVYLAALTMETIVAVRRLNSLSTS